MRFHAGLPPDEFEPDASWQALREPAPSKATRQALPLGLLLFCAVALTWTLLGASPLTALRVQAGWGEAVRVFWGLALLVVAHELIHAFVHPHLGTSRHTVLGASVRPLLLYAAYQASLSRNRFIAILLAPFAVLTLLPLLAHAAGLLEQPLAQILATGSVVNAALSSLDVFGALLLVRQVPSTAQVKNKGWQTYWRHSVA